mmetsp:Transcript_8156/g.34283  ORF Transcript_8156/g.34283 Transcript_8156/m.34283 type:complete len:200 (+) Transcript_8156:494-1093(+)
MDEVRRWITREINRAVRKLVRVHSLPQWVVDPEDGLASIGQLADAIDEDADAQLMVLVDEYDRFANQLLLEDRVAYDAVVGQSSGSSPAGPLRSLMETLKKVSTMLGSRFRSLVTGVSPVALHDANGYVPLPLSQHWRLVWLYECRCREGLASDIASGRGAWIGSQEDDGALRWLPLPRGHVGCIGLRGCLNGFGMGFR